MNDEIQKQTTEGITFRIPSSSINQLRRIKKEASESEYASKSDPKDHLDWHTHAARARMFHVPRSTFSRLVDNLTEEELSKHSHYCQERLCRHRTLIERRIYSCIIPKYPGKPVTNIFLSL
jgi:hypothetical protein